jgi:uncharacterized secreted protein with C-terminal beta-propeller domain
MGALAALPALSGCAETASAADAKLERFTSCAALTKYMQTNALENLGPYGIGTAVTGAITRTGVDSFGVSEDSAGGLAAAPGAARPATKTPGTDFSTTNVQEAGVDEPDIVKTDGNRIFAIAKNRLYAIDVSGPTPRVAGSIAMPKDAFARDMLISGNRLLVMADGPVTVRPLPAQPGAEPGAATRLGPSGSFPGSGGSLLIQVDVTDPAAMRVTETMETEARYVNARLTGTTARVVIVGGAPTGIAFTYPAEPGPKAEQDALRANRNALARTTADDWLPRYTIHSTNGASAPRPVVSCDAVSRPPDFAGMGSLTVLTIDMATGLTPIDSDAVMAGGENVYASPQALYVATNRWAMPNAKGTLEGLDTTQIHRFDTSNPFETSYDGSGSVTGHLLNQFSMSEHEGRLRVATTDSGVGVVGEDVIVDNGTGGSQSYVTVLEESGDKLAQVGQVGGLGKGERIYAVRFIGDRGYVVTFRQTDPLYTVDLSDPAAPRVAGELKILGYSAYLHPIGDDLLIGVGQDATDEGRTKGLQVSLFDVSDPASPKRLHNAVMPGARSDAEWDHRAFLWWAKTSTAVIPYNQEIAVPTPGPADVPGSGIVAPSIAPVPGFESGALAMRVSPDGIVETGRVRHPSDPNYFGGVRRTLVVGDTLFTVSESGIKASALDGFAERAWLAFS